VDLRRLGLDDDRSTFSCGDAQLDEFFRTRAGQNQFKHQASVTYVLADGADIAGFVTVVPGTVRRDDLGAANRRLPQGALPVLVLARMGVSTSHQRKGLGDRLLGKVTELALALVRDVGCVGIIVDSKPDARGFYERYGFAWLGGEMSSDIARGFLATRTIQAAVPNPSPK
jgi:predicted N-acetyltransferase YhbS